jgi:hypothetical protein
VRARDHDGRLVGGGGPSCSGRDVRQPTGLAFGVGLRAIYARISLLTAHVSPRKH